MRPCKSTYHQQCFRVGAPFTSRRNNSAGLTFPNVKYWGSFICEACTVRAVVDRELHDESDWKLLCYERMRVLDMVHHWSTGTNKTYQSKLGAIRRFEEDFDIPGAILRPTKIERPPNSSDIPLMWCQEAYSLRKSPGEENLTVKFGTVRQLRSATSQFEAWESAVSAPSEAYLDDKRRLIRQPTRTTDSIGSQLHASGMGSRLGYMSSPSMALLDRHVRSMDSDLDQQFQAATRFSDKRQLALAGFANLLFWLGWLRSSEVFNLRWEDLECVPPHRGDEYELPRGVGVILARLLPETKSNRVTTADVVMAYKTLSGLHLGKWYHRALSYRRQHDTHIFCHQTGALWTSRFFRKNFLYPSLLKQQAAGDAYLRPFVNNLEQKFWSLHCYRRGARSRVSKGGSRNGYTFRKATTDQTYEHARWRLRRSSESIDKVYQQWEIIDRIKITLYCM
jgi:hypothetical protein